MMERHHNRHCVILHSFVLRHSSFVIVDQRLVGRVNWPMRFGKLPLVVTLFTVCASFLPGETQSGSETGIEGVITIIPSRPGPVRIDAPNSPLANTVFVVETQKGEVASFTTDAQGRFRMPLAPGHYKVSLRERTSSIGRYGPFEVDVVAGQMTKAQWQCDSGIR